MAGIPIQNHKLTKEQYIKLFSNPVSGIACDMIHGAGTNYDYAHFGRWHLKNIRYSKSMLEFALEFWNKQMNKYYDKINKIYNPLQGRITQQLAEQIVEIMDIRESVSKLPDTFLFSHRHIEEMNINHYRNYGGKNPAQTNHLLNKKYNMHFRPQEQTMQHFTRIKTNVGIEFTVFPNEHPYITKQKINRVGMTDAGNVFVLHKAEKK